MQETINEIILKLTDSKNKNIRTKCPMLNSLGTIHYTILYRAGNISGNLQRDIESHLYLRQT